MTGTTDVPEAPLLSPRLLQVATTTRGDGIYREPNGAGGHRYWSDAIGGGVVIRDTCLASVEELEVAMRVERESGR